MARPRKPESERVERISVSLTPERKAILESLGTDTYGSAILHLIDQAGAKSNSKIEQRKRQRKSDSG